MTCDEVKPLLNARMDGEIDPIQRAAVDSHVEACPSCAADLEVLESVREAIRSKMRYSEAPPGLRDRVQSALRGAEYLDGGPHRTDWRILGAVAAALVLVALGAVPFFVNARNQRHLVAEELLSAHVRALMGHSLDVVSSDQHTVKPWFSGKLPFSPPVVNLASEGFPLEGARLDYAGGRPVAALVYGRRLHRIDVFVRPLTGQTAPPSHFERDGYNEISWTKDNFVFTAVSDLNAAELSAFAGLLQRR
jgi:anti-sigma factor (TIGR02949 family)